VIKICLRFANEQEADDVLNSLIPEAIDVIGAIHDDVGSQIPGWHVNLILNEDIPESLNSFVIYPATPYRTWL
jgi:hypothetical protein